MSTTPGSITEGERVYARTKVYEACQNDVGVELSVWQTRALLRSILDDGQVRVTLSNEVRRLQKELDRVNDRFESAVIYSYKRDDRVGDDGTNIVG
jgi:hypothetical protein